MLRFFFVDVWQLSPSPSVNNRSIVVVFSNFFYFGAAGIIFIFGLHSVCPRSSFHHTVVNLSRCSAATKHFRADTSRLRLVSSYCSAAMTHCCVDTSRRRLVSSRCSAATTHCSAAASHYSALFGSKRMAKHSSVTATSPNALKHSGPGALSALLQTAT